jgi:hypothetical protein
MTGLDSICFAITVSVGEPHGMLKSLNNWLKLIKTQMEKILQALPSEQQTQYKKKRISISLVPDSPLV